MAEKKDQRFNSPVSLHVRSYRYRLTDADGISAKAAIDGLVHLGILVDDRPEFVREVSYSQEKIKKPELEKTVITIKEIK